MKYLISVIVLIYLSISIQAQTRIEHTVSSGETLASIAARYGVTEDQVVKDNPSTASLLYPGMKLTITSTGALTSLDLSVEEDDSGPGFSISDGWRKRFVNLSFTNTVIKQEGIQDLKSSFGVSFAIGRTFFLHEPLWNALRFGIDATWIDLNYANYKIQYITFQDTENYQYHQAEISVHAGPSVTYNPIEKLSVHGYFQYCPTFAAIYTGDNSNLYGNYASLWVGGASASYGFVGLGFEARFGSTGYRPLKASDAEAWNASMSGWRVYLTLRF